MSCTIAKLNLFLGACALFAAIAAGASRPLPGQERSDPTTSAEPLDRLEELLPADVEAWDEVDLEQVRRQVSAVEGWAARWGSAESSDVPRDAAWSPREVLRHVTQLLLAHRRVEALNERVIGLRSGFRAGSRSDPRRRRIRMFLAVSEQLIDLSGRLRFQLADAIDGASYELDPHPARFQELLDLLTRHRSAVGARVMSYVLFDPEASSGAVPYPDEVKLAALRLIAAARSSDLLPELADYLDQPNQAPTLRLMATDVIWYLGVPQEPRPGSDPTLPPPPITARRMITVLRGEGVRGLTGEVGRRRDELIDLLRRRAERGVDGETFRYGRLSLQAGDWLLMKNPSPYNSFTDLAPGLFSHVGVVTTETGADGIRRFLIVDLPERGDRVPATTVDQYLDRTLHYFFVRHGDEKVAARMGEVARQLIGRATQFDLTFHTDRVARYRGRVEADEPLNTYCAGFLLVCAQETSAPVDSFFPVREYASSARCLENLAQLGMAIGDEFVSPTGALFSSDLAIVGKCEPMYDPGRAITQGVYDHFAEGMRDRELEPALTAMQALRAKVAGLSEFNPWLARALAEANNVSEHMDLKSAAQAAAVIETLDEIAERQGGEYFAAFDAILDLPAPDEASDTEQLAERDAYRQRHASLARRWTTGELTARQLRRQLVQYYLRHGREEVDERFFDSDSR